MGQHSTHQKLCLQELFSFKVRQHGQQRLHLQYKVCWFFCKVVSAPSFSEPYLFKQPPLQSPPKIRSSLVNFHLPTLPLLIHKFILTILTNTSFLYQFLTSLFLRTTIPTIYTKTIFPINGPGSWHSFDLSLLQSMDSNNRAHNHWFLT